MSTVKVADRVKYNKEYGTVSYVDEYSFRVNWDDGGVSTEIMDSFSEDGIELLVDNEDWWAKKYGAVVTPETGLTEDQQKQLVEYFQGLNKKYPEESERTKYKHYFKDVSNLDKIDIYRVLELWEVHHPCLQHAAKKILVAGNRGHKNIEKDIQEAIDSLERYKQMLIEDNKEKE